MTSCGACNKQIQDLNFMECSNKKCGLLFCLLCVNKTQAEFDQFTDYFKADWLCPQCIAKVPKGDHTPMRSATGSQLNDTFTKNINVTRGNRLNSKTSDQNLDPQKDIDAGSQMALLVEEIRHLRREVKDLKDSNLELKGSMHKIESLLTLTSNKLAEETARIGKIREDMLTLQITVSNLQNANAVLEQENIRNEIEIIGVPETNDENLGHIVMTACNKIGVELKEDDIDDIFRAGPKQRKDSDKNRLRPVVVKLVRHRKRDAILKAARTRRNITAKDVIDGAPGNIYFNERLTKQNRNLFRDARLRSSSHNFRYCWTRNGNIFVRCSDGRPAIRIVTAEDLDKKIGPQKQQSPNAEEIYENKESNGNLAN
ncbi:hypothetical protein NE865_11519 [Phthorimaea operculella]|nr:hypothetical protein NE865_11519 [Phthorimaea operculella]